MAEIKKGGELATATLEQSNLTLKAPEWVHKLSRKFAAGVAHTFILTGNVRDIIDSKNTLQRYLSLRFCVQGPNRPVYDIVAFYDRANGLHFALEEQKKRFLEAYEMAIAVKQPQTSTNPAAQAALQTAFGGAQKQEKNLPRDPIAAFEMVEKVISRCDRKATEGGKEKELHMVFIVDYAESIFPAGEWNSLNQEDRNCIVKLLNWAKDERIQEAANPIILITDSASKIHAQITASASRIEVIELMLPAPDERAQYIEYLDRGLRNEGQSGLKFEKGFDARKFAATTAGLKKLNIEDIKLTAEVADVPIGPELVKERKFEIMMQEYNSVLEVVEPDFGFEAVGGMDWMKDYLLKNVVRPMLENDKKRCPQGLLFIGPPGTGKSYLAKALAKESKMNMVSLNIGRLLGGIVGESEHNMQKALLAIRSLTPVMVFIDEIDQAISRGAHGDSGVSNRLFKALLEFMSDTKLRGHVTFIAASNRPDTLDPALKRTGRFDKKIPFLPPDAPERAEVFPAVMKRYDIKSTGEIDFNALAARTEDWVQSDIEAAVVKAYQVAGLKDRNSIRQEDLVRAVTTIVPSTADTRLWSRIAQLETNDMDLLPPKYRKDFDRASLEKEVKTLSDDSLSLRMEEQGRKVRREIV